MPMDLQTLTEQLRDFARRRDWGKYHSPKNIAMALAVEAAELMEPMQWLTEEQSRQPDAATRARLEDEMADVLLYLLQLADALDVDVLQAAFAKMQRNETRFPPV